MSNTDYIKTFYKILENTKDFKGVFDSENHLRRSLSNDKDISEFYGIVNNSDDFDGVYPTEDSFRRSLGLPSKKKEDTQSDSGQSESLSTSTSTSRDFATTPEEGLQQSQDLNYEPGGLVKTKKETFTTTPEKAVGGLKSSMFSTPEAKDKAVTSLLDFNEKYGTVYTKDEYEGKESTPDQKAALILRQAAKLNAKSNDVPDFADVYRKQGERQLAYMESSKLSDKEMTDMVKAEYDKWTNTPEYKSIYQQASQGANSAFEQKKAELQQLVNQNKISANVANSQLHGLAEGLNAKVSDAVSQEWEKHYKDNVKPVLNKTIADEQTKRYINLLKSNNLLSRRAVWTIDNIARRDEFLQMSLHEKKKAIANIWDFTKTALIKKGYDKDYIQRYKEQFVGEFVQRAYKDKEGKATSYSIKDWGETALKEIDEREKELMLQSKSTQNRFVPSIGGGSSTFANVNDYSEEVRDELANLMQAKDKIKSVLAMPEKNQGTLLDGLKYGFVNDKDIPLPYVKTMIDLNNNLNIWEAVKKAKEGKQLTEGEKFVLHSSGMEQTYNENVKTATSFGIGKGTAYAIPYMVDFVAGGWAAAPIRSTVAKSIEGVAGKVAEKAIFKNAVTRPLSVIMGEVARTASNPAAWTNNTIKHMTPEIRFSLGGEKENAMIKNVKIDDMVAVLDSNTRNIDGSKTGKGMDPIEAFAYGFLDTYIENLTENLGGAFSLIGNDIISYLIKNKEWAKRLYIGYALKMNGGLTEGSVAKTMMQLRKGISSQTGYNGFLGENIEEWGAAVAEDFLYGRKFGQSFTEDFLKETAGVTGLIQIPFTVLGVGAKAIDKFAGGGKKMKLNYQDQNGFVQNVDVPVGEFAKAYKALKQGKVALVDWLNNELGKTNLNPQQRLAVEQAIQSKMYWDEVDVQSKSMFGVAFEKLNDSKQQEVKQKAYESILPYIKGKTAQLQQVLEQIEKEYWKTLPVEDVVAEEIPGTGTQPEVKTEFVPAEGGTNISSQKQLPAGPSVKSLPPMTVEEEGDFDKTEERLFTILESMQRGLPISEEDRYIISQNYEWFADNGIETPEFEFSMPKEDKEVYDQFTDVEKQTFSNLDEENQAKMLDAKKQELNVGVAPVDMTEEEQKTFEKMKPITDEMVKVEREFSNNGFNIDWDYDNEIIVTDKNGDIVDPEDLPENLQALASEYETATMQLGNYDSGILQKALASSREITDIEGEDVTGQKPQLTPKSNRQLDKEYPESSREFMNDLRDEFFSANGITEEDYNELSEDEKNKLDRKYQTFIESKTKEEIESESKPAKKVKMKFEPESKDDYLADALLGVRIDLQSLIDVVGDKMLAIGKKGNPYAINWGGGKQGISDVANDLTNDSTSIYYERDSIELTQDIADFIVANPGGAKSYINQRIKEIEMQKIEDEEQLKKDMEEHGIDFNNLPDFKIVESLTDEEAEALYNALNDTYGDDLSRLSNDLDAWEKDKDPFTPLSVIFNRVIPDVDIDAAFQGVRKIYEKQKSKGEGEAKKPTPPSKTGTKQAKVKIGQAKDIDIDLGDLDVLMESDLFGGKETGKKSKSDFRKDYDEMLNAGKRELRTAAKELDELVKRARQEGIEDKKIEEITRTKRIRYEQALKQLAIIRDMEKNVGIGEQSQQTLFMAKAPMDIQKVYDKKLTQEQIDKGMAIIDKFFSQGIYSFSDIAGTIQSKVNNDEKFEQMIPSLVALYGQKYNQVEDDIADKMDARKEVRRVVQDYFDAKESGVETEEGGEEQGTEENVTPKRLTEAQQNDMSFEEKAKYVSENYPQYKDLMDEALEYYNKVKDVMEKTSKDYVAGKFPKIERFFYTLNFKVPNQEKINEGVEILEKSIEASKEFIKNLPSESELQAIKKQYEDSVQAKDAETKKQIDDAKVRMEEFKRLESINSGFKQYLKQEYNYTTSPYGSEIGSYLYNGYTLKQIEFGVRLKNIIESIDNGEKKIDLGKVLEFASKSNFDKNDLIRKVKDKNFGDLFFTVKTDKFVDEVSSIDSKPYYNESNAIVEDAVSKTYTSEHYGKIKGTIIPSSQGNFVSVEMSEPIDGSGFTDVVNMTSKDFLYNIQNGYFNLKQDENTGNEPNSGGVSATNGMGQTNIPNDTKGVQPNVEGGVQPTEGGGQINTSNTGVPGNVTPTGGTSSNINVSGAKPGVETVSTPSGNTRGGTPSSSTGQTSVGGGPNTNAPLTQNPVGIGSNKTLDQKLVLQREAEPIEVTIQNEDGTYNEDDHTENVKKTLPIALSSQVEDIVKAEKSMFVNGNKAVLFTNGTGTGKTTTALGIVKRFVKKENARVLIVTPNQEVNKGFVNEGGWVVLSPYILESTTDVGAGKSVVITTHANWRENENLHKEKFDMIVVDESDQIMSNMAGEATKAVDALRKMANHYYFAQQEAYKNLGGPEMASLIEQLDDIDSQMMAMNKQNLDYEAYGVLRGKRESILEKLNAIRKTITTEMLDEETAKVEARTKVVFLSATPFSSEKALDYAEGFLFKYPLIDGYRNQNKFLEQNFGYQLKASGNIKSGQLSADVNKGMLERAFHEALRKEGVLFRRQLDSEYDYSRNFLLLLDPEGMAGIGRMIDEGVEILEKEYKLGPVVAKKMNYLYKMRLLEAYKAKMIIPFMEKMLAERKKIVVFHNYNEGLPSHPFHFTPQDVQEVVKGDMAQYQAYMTQIRNFEEKYPQYYNLDMSGLKNPILTLTEAFGDRAVLYNGSVTNKKRTQVKNEFNFGAKDIIIIQKEAGKAGISLHDTQGIKDRILINLGLPVRSNDAIQSEGRIYRVGNMSNAAFIYPVIHTNFERFTFSEKVGPRSGTSENFALGDLARGLDVAFREGYLGAEPEITDMGLGGKEADQRVNTMTPFEAAKMHYALRGKRTKNSPLMGVDFFPTPEPVGFKMVQWADMKPGNEVLEPSAGQGSISRYFPQDVSAEIIEPSADLRSIASMLSQNPSQFNSFGYRFEDHNKINKYDRIVMNPPFGTAGNTAMKHVAQAFDHLRDGGRIVALVPTGKMVDRLNEFFYGNEAKGLKPNDNAILRGVYMLPDFAFKKDAAQVNTMIIIIDKINDKEEAERVEAMGGSNLTAPNMTLKGTNNMKELFDAIENMNAPAVVDIKTLDKKPAPDTKVDSEIKAEVIKNYHKMKKRDNWVVKLSDRVSTNDYNVINAKAQSLNGYYSRYSKEGAIPGFQFDNEANANQLAEFINNGYADSPSLMANKDGQIDYPLTESELEFRDNLVTALSNTFEGIVDEVILAPLNEWNIPMDMSSMMAKYNYPRYVVEQLARYNEEDFHNRVGISVGVKARKAQLEKKYPNLRFAVMRTYDNYITSQVIGYIYNPKDLVPVENPKPKIDLQGEFTDSKMQILGAYYNGKIYLDPRIARPETVIHEFAHPFLDMIQEKRNDIFQKGMELIEGTPYLDEVNSSPAYANKSEIDKKKEALVRAIHDKGVALAKNEKRGFLSWLRKFWNSIKDIVGIQNVTAEELSNMTLDDFTAASVRTMFDKEAMQGLKGEKETLDEAYNKAKQDLIDEWNSQGMNLGIMPQPPTDPFSKNLFMKAVRFAYYAVRKGAKSIGEVLANTGFKINEWWRNVFKHAQKAQSVPQTTEYSGDLSIMSQENTDGLITLVNKLMEMNPRNMTELRDGLNIIEAMASYLPDSNDVVAAVKSLRTMAETYPFETMKDYIMNLAERNEVEVALDRNGVLQLVYNEKAQKLDLEKAFSLAQEVKDVLNSFGIKVSEKRRIRGALGRFFVKTKNVELLSLMEMYTAIHEAMHFLDDKHGLAEKVMKTNGAARRDLEDIYLDLYPNAKEKHPSRLKIIEGMAVLMNEYLHDPTGTEINYPHAVKAFLKPDGEFYVEDVENLMNAMAKILEKVRRLDLPYRLQLRLADWNAVIKQQNFLKNYTWKNITPADVGMYRWLRFQLNQAAFPKELDMLAKTSYSDESLHLAYFNAQRASQIAHGWLVGGDASYKIGGKEIKLGSSGATIYAGKGQHKFSKATVKVLVDKVLSIGDKLGMDRETALKSFEGYLIARRMQGDYNRMIDAKNILEAYKASVDLDDLEDFQSDIIDRLTEDYESKRAIVENDNQDIASIQANINLFGDKFKEATAVFDEINRNLLDFAKNTGIISKANYDKWKEEGDYASFQRIIFDDLDFQGQEGVGSNVYIATPGQFKQRKGNATRTFVGPLTAMVLHIPQTISRGYQNLFWKSFADYVTKHGDKFYITKNTVAEDFRYMPKTAMMVNGVANYAHLDNVVKSGKAISFMVNGKKVYYKTAPWIQAMASTMINEVNHELLEAAMKASVDRLAKLTTGANPYFALQNISIDQLSSLFTTKTNKLLPVVDDFFIFLKEYESVLNLLGKKIGVDILTPTEISKLEKFLHLGGNRLNLSSSYDNKTVKDLIDEIAPEFELKKLPGKTIDKVIDALSIPVNLSELITRFGEFSRALDMGDSEQLAFFKANQLMPFNERPVAGGKVGRVALRGVPYTNPGIRGTEKIVEAMAENPKRSAIYISLIAATAVSSIIYGWIAMSAGDDDDKNKMQEQKARLLSTTPEELSKYMLVWTGKEFIKLRVPEPVGSIVGWSQMGVISYLHQRETRLSGTYSKKEWVAPLISNLPYGLRQTGLFGEAALTFDPDPLVRAMFETMPQIVSPGFSTALGIKYYPHIQPIVPDYIAENKLPVYQYDRYTSNLSKAMSRKLYEWFGNTIAPKKIDHYLNQQFGSDVRFINQSFSDEGLQSIKSPWVYGSGRSWLRGREYEKFKANLEEVTRQKGSTIEKLSHIYGIDLETIQEVFNDLKITPRDFANTKNILELSKISPNAAKSITETYRQYKNMSNVAEIIKLVSEYNNEYDDLPGSFKSDFFNMMHAYNTNPLESSARIKEVGGQLSSLILKKRDKQDLGSLMYNKLNNDKNKINKILNLLK